MVSERAARRCEAVNSRLAALAEWLAAPGRVAGTVRTGAPMSRHTSLRVGGPADVLVVAESAADVATTVAAAAAAGVPFLTVGAGTNLLVSDAGVRGLVVLVGRGLADYRLDGHRLVAGAGTAVAKVARQLAAAGWGGLEFAIGIPGSVGGLVVMNAGTSSGEAGDVVSLVRTVDASGAEVVLERADLGYGYRASRLQRGDLVVVGAEFDLHRVNPADALAAAAAELAYRRRTQPLAWPNAGSIFRNPPGQRAGRLLEAAGLKGRRIGGAEVSRRHANFIINTGGATAADVVALMTMMQQVVWDNAGIRLEPEIRLVGPELPGVPA